MTTTIRAVAEAAGVSTTTVSFVLNNRHPQVDAIPEETRQRVRDAAISLGYRRNAAAASLRTGRSHWIGIIVQPLRDEQDAHMWAPYELALLSGAQNTLTRRGYFAVLGAKSPTGGTEYLDEIVPSGIGGLIYRRPLRKEVRRLEELAQEGIPSIAVFPRNKGDLYPYIIDMDNVKAGELAAEVLIRAGSVRPMYVVNDPTYALHPDIDRVAGFTRVVQKELGFTPIKCELPQVETDIDKLEFLTKFIKEHRPDGVMGAEAGSSYLAGIAAEKNNIDIPREMSLIGFDCYFFPSERGHRMSAVATSWWRAGQAAAEGILDIVNNNTKWTEPMKLDPVFVPGDTTPPEIAEGSSFYWVF